MRQTLHLNYFLNIISIFIFTYNIFSQQKAFPGAEGFGAYSVGGRGGRIIEVTNLNASGTGSLKAACEANGPRIVIFKVGGTIKSAIDIYINNPYLTIAGQTAPGDGIVLRGAAIRPSTHDVIIRGLRFRVGNDPEGTTFSNRDGLGIEDPDNPSYNIIVDHCSFAWATDENVVTWYESHDITIQWCNISEALLRSDGEDGYGALLGYRDDRVSILHNIFAHNGRRNPLAQGGPSRFEIINNLVYNWGVQPMSLESKKDGPCSANIIGNFMLEGPSTSFSWIDKGIQLMTSGNQALRSDSRIYVKNNLGPGRMNDTLDEWAIVDGPESFRSAAPIMDISDCTVYPVESIYEILLQNAGATVPHLDPVDQGIVNDIRNRSGSLPFINSQLPWPEITNGTSPADNDSDGMPDYWENQNGLNPNSSSDANLDRNEDGYTNIEEYINSLIPYISITNGTVSTPTNFRISN